MIKIKKSVVLRSKRTDAIIWLRQNYEGNLHANPEVYNRAFADVLRKMADAIEAVKNAWVDPEVVVWLHETGKISAEARLSAPIGRKGK